MKQEKLPVESLENSSTNTKKLLAAGLLGAVAVATFASSEIVMNGFDDFPGGLFSKHAVSFAIASFSILGSIFSDRS